MKKLTVTLLAMLLVACASGPQKVELPLPQDPPLTGLFQGTKEEAQWKRAYNQSGGECGVKPAQSEAAGATGMAAGALNLLGPIGSLGGAIVGSAIDATSNTVKNQKLEEEGKRKICWLLVFEDGTNAQYMVLPRSEAVRIVKKTGFRAGKYTEIPFVDGVMYRPW